MDQLPDYYPDDYWQIVDGAMDEGSMHIYTSWFGALAEQTVGHFNEFFDFLDIEITTLGTAQLFQRFSNEAARGRVEPDLVFTYDPIAIAQLYSQDLLQNYVSSETEYFPDRAQTDIDGLVLSTQSVNAHGFNTSALNDAGKEVPTTVQELADGIEDDPDFWNQNFAMYDGVTSTSAWQQMDFYAEALGEDTMLSLWETLASGTPQTFNSTSTMGEWIATGQVAFGVGMSAYVLGNYILPDYSADQIRYGDRLVTNIMWPNPQVTSGASNPNAAKLFADYYLSERGQLNLINQWRMTPARSNIDPNEVPEDPFWGVAPTQEVLQEELDALDSVWMPFQERLYRGDKKAQYKEQWYNMFS